MDKIKTIEGDLNARDMRVSIVAGRFNEFIVESLIKGASVLLGASFVGGETNEGTAPS